MKKRFWILAAAVTLALAAGTASAAAALGQGEDPAPSEADLSDSGYVLMEHQGEIGIFRRGELLGSAGVPVSTLRAADRELLRQGIQVASYEEVLMLLEDFGA